MKPLKIQRLKKNALIIKTGEKKTTNLAYPKYIPKTSVLPCIPLRDAPKNARDSIRDTPQLPPIMIMELPKDSGKQKVKQIAKKFRKTIKEAVKWLRLAADQKHEQAQFKFASHSFWLKETSLSILTLAKFFSDICS
jgi:hypothetical protein